MHDNGKTPPGLVVLSESPIVDHEGQASVSQSSFYQQGGMVFTAGTTDWSWALDDYWQKDYLDPRIQRVTANLLDEFRAGAAPGAAPPPASDLEPLLLALAAGSLAVSVAATTSVVLLRRRAAQAPAENWD